GAKRLGPFRRQVTRLARLELAKLPQIFACLDKGLGGEAVAFASLGGLKRSLPAGADDEIAVPVMDRPLVAAPAGQRRQARLLELTHRAQQIVPGLDRLAIDAGLRELFLVVEDGHRAGLVRHGPDAVVEPEPGEDARAKAVPPGAAIGIHSLGQVLDGAGCRLLLQHATAPAVEDVRPL